ncbi:MAG: glycine cleavage system protein H [Vicinamibacteria bacterium]|jgi:hypothetical protein|nr:glycine cleavage system protein H [Vicinamibacteria bacterium]
MFPWSPEFRWDAGHVIFFGALYSVLATIALTVLFAARRTQQGLDQGLAEHADWHAAFEELPSAARACRHQLSGGAPGRICGNAFDCRHCATHSTLAACAPDAVTDASETIECFGLKVPLDRYYHRGHTWVRPEQDGTCTIGLDDLGQRLIGAPEVVELPAPGARLAVNGTAARVQSHGASVRILAPVSGTIIEGRGRDARFTLRVKPDGALDLRHLLGAREVRAWFLREIERLELALQPAGAAGTLADGGLVMRDAGSVLPRRDYDRLLGEMFLAA